MLPACASFHSSPEEKLNSRTTSQMVRQQKVVRQLTFRGNNSKAGVYMVLFVWSMFQITTERLMPTCLHVICASLTRK